MKKSNRKNTIKSIMLALILITLCLFFISNTYARYTNSFTGNAEATVAKWAVKLNDKTPSAFTTTDMTFKVDTNANVVEGKIAPSVTARAKLVLDLTGTEVNTEYKATIDDTAKATFFGTSASDVTVTINDTTGGTVGTNGYTVAPGFGASGYTAACAPVEVVITWTNAEANNTQDTALGVAAGTFQIPVTLEARQVISGT